MRNSSLLISALALALILHSGRSICAETVEISGIYPHLAMFNDESECGTGAVVPWADRLWVITYAPHMPTGSTDKLYEITSDLKQIIRPESTGGTPANRMIHRKSQQLFIGPYASDFQGKVRAIPYGTMFGRPTGNARHLTDPAGKILYATMEEGIYEVNVKTLAVTELWGDEQVNNKRRKSELPGYHGKGFYSGQGVYIYSNNGEHGKEARTRPDVPSGVLAQWDGKSDAWNIVRRNQFTEVTGPGGIHGNADPATDPVWAVGWDHRSLMLGVRTPELGWTYYRLPKGSHSYDDARVAVADIRFAGVANVGEEFTGGLIRARAGNKRTLSFAAVDANGNDIGYYELDGKLQLTRIADTGLHTYTKQHTAIPLGILTHDSASVIYTDDDGKRWRLPQGDSGMDRNPLGRCRIAREVATERDLLNAHGTFYELPARNAGGFAKIRAIATHNRHVHDFCSYRGLFVISGIASTAPRDNPHIVHSDDKKTALWVGAIDDAWKLGKPRGHGGPWKDTVVVAGMASDPYLMTGYDRKRLTLTAAKNAEITAEIDIDGTGHWVRYKMFSLTGGKPNAYEFPDSFQAYWIRFVSDKDTTATAQLTYE